MKESKREFQIFVKPAGARCNMNCSYCYYLEKKSLYPDFNFLMDDQTLELYTRQIIDATDEDYVMFSWHGGEPTLAGLDFFRKAVELQHRFMPSDKRAINGIQTNGTLLDETWCSFLAEEKFIVGISIDGPGSLHNINRMLGEGKPSLNKVLHGYGLLRKYRIPAEILCVVNSRNVKQPHVVYDFIKDLGAKYITFLPLVEKDPDSPGCVTARSVSSDEFGKFLCAVFDKWIENDIGRITIQIFEEATRKAFGSEHTLCIFKVNCGGVPVIEHNGDFYSCDHYVDKEHFIGNIKEGSIAWFLDDERQQAFGRAKSLTLPRYCRECNVLDMCNGECPKNRFIMTPDGEPGLNYLCSAYKMFFNHCLPFVEALKQVLLNEKGNA